MGGVQPFPAAPTVGTEGDVVGRAKRLASGLRGVPEFVVDNAQLRTLSDVPFVARQSPRDNLYLCRADA